MEWRAICLDCRALLGEETCDEAGHRAVALDSAGRRQLLAEVWGEPRTTARLLPWSKRYSWALWRAALGVIATIVACVPFAACGDHPLDELVSARMWLFIALIIAIVVPALLFEAWAEHAQDRSATEQVSIEDEPRTVPWRRPRVGERAEGVVRSPDCEISPLTGKRCAAWGVWLGTDEGLSLRAGWSSELEIELEEGRVLRVPRGRARFDESEPPDPASTEAARGFLSGLGVERGTARDDPFPHAAAWELVISSGDRVEISAAFERQPARESEGTGYRRAEHELVAKGAPELRRQRAPAAPDASSRVHRGT